MSLNEQLYNACKSGSLQEVEKLVKLGANDFNWYLECACKYGHLPIVNRLIELGANHFD
jgi:hypothetical protein